MLKFFKKLFGTKYDRDVKQYSPVINQINQHFESYASLSNDELRNKTLEFRAIIADGLKDIDADILALQNNAETEQDLNVKEQIFDNIDELKKKKDEQLEVILKNILPEAFATVKETARRFSQGAVTVTATDHDRMIAAKKSNVIIDGDKAIWANTWMAAGAEVTWNMVHYDVQLIGGQVLHDGKIAEMQTGEGKTLVATLPAYLNGLSGLGVHVVTVNDYLAKRDSEWIGPIFEFLFLTIDCIDKYRPHSPERVEAYKCDIVYGTNNEFGFDYLRDNMVRSSAELVQGKHHFAMIDEVDSVLIDDARTPLIISGPIPEGSEEQEYNELNPKVAVMVEAQKKLATKYLTEAKKLIAAGSIGHQEGEGGLALFRAFRAMPKYRPLIKYLSEEGIKVILQKTENTYMEQQSKNMHIADEPLLFTIDEKTRQVDLTEKGAEFLARGENDHNFFIMPDITTEMQKLDNREKREGIKLSDEKEALIQDFSVKSRRLHSVSQLLKAYTLFEKNKEYVVMDGQVKIVDESTGRMMEGRRYSDGLHQALEAKEQVELGDLTQTYATVTLQNYFRMYHKLSGMTGTAETEAGEFWEIYKLDVVVIPTNRPIARHDKEDLVYKTQREKFNAVADHIVELTQQGRPVLVGTTSVEISEVLSRMLNMRGIKHNVLNAKQHAREADIVAEAGRPGAVTIATNMAGRGTDIKLSKEIKDAGGLAIIATERHDSRRVDRQLRGRAGRQGDPGSSQFFVSLEDNLMRLFQSERIAKMMDRMGHKEGEVIQHSMVSRSIGNAQKKVEENNFGIRKRLLEYDDVMNIQREAIYKRRNNALKGERLEVDLRNMFEGLIDAIVYNHKDAGATFEQFEMVCFRLLGIDPPFSAEEYSSMSADQIVNILQSECRKGYDHKSEHIKQLLLPLIANVKANEGDRYKRITVPFTDGRTSALNISADIDDALASNGDSIIKDIEKAVTLALIDENWKEHLRKMDELKDSVQSASFEQKDPLVIYKKEAYNLFESLMYQTNKDVISYLMNGKLLIAQNLQEAKEETTDFTEVKENKTEQAMREAAENVSQNQAPQPPKVETFKREGDKIGRNAPCPCGSGKKYKQCHGK